LCFCMLVTIWMRGFCCENVLDGWKNCCIVTFLYLVYGQSYFLFNGKCIKRAMYILRGMWCCSWSRHCAMSWKFVDFIPSRVGILRWYNPYSRTMALGVNLASNRNQYQEYILVAKGGQCIGLTALPPIMCWMSRNVGVSTWNPQDLP
jgi:hypothetical protein